MGIPTLLDLQIIISNPQTKQGTGDDQIMQTMFTAILDLALDIDGKCCTIFNDDEPVYSNLHHYVTMTATIMYCLQH